MAMDDRAIAVIEKFKGDRTLNQYARDLDIDPGQLWRILKGEQGPNRAIVALLRVYPERGSEIATALAAPDAEKVAGAA
jgi:hypothetical protein